MFVLIFQTFSNKQQKELLKTFFFVDLGCCFFNFEAILTYLPIQWLIRMFCI